MEITFDKDTLTKATKWTTDIVDAKNDTETIRMEVTPEEVTFSSISSEGERSIRTTADIKDVDKEIVLNLHAGALKKIPTQATSGTITFRYNPGKDKTKIFVNAGVRLSVPLMSGGHRSLHGVDGMTDAGSCVPADLFGMVKFLSLVTDPAAEAAVFSCIDLTLNGVDTIRGMAIDSYVMSVRDIPYSPVDNEEHRFALLANDVKQLSEASDATEVEIYVDSNSVAFVFNDGRTARINFMSGAGDTEYEQLIFKDRDDETFTIDRKEFQTAVQKLSSWNADDTVQLDINPDEDVMTVKSQDGDWIMSVPMTENTVTEENTVTFNRGILTKTIKASDGVSLRGRFVPDAEGSEAAFVWDQLDSTGDTDDTVYVMCLPYIEEE